MKMILFTAYLLIKNAAADARSKKTMGGMFEMICSNYNLFFEDINAKLAAFILRCIFAGEIGVGSYRFECSYWVNSWPYL